MRMKINWDAIVITATVACAIHCAVLPLFLTSLPLFGLNIVDNQSFELIMILVAFAIGVFSLTHGFKKHHHRRFPLLLLAIGFGIMILKQVYLHYAIWLLIPAVIFIVVAHVLNFRYCRNAKHCHTTDCNH